MNRELKEIIFNKNTIKNIIYYSSLYFFPVQTSIYSMTKKIIYRK